MSSDNEDYPDNNYGIDDDFTKSFKKNEDANSEDGTYKMFLTIEIFVIKNNPY